VDLVICEKGDAAKRISHLLAEDGVEQIGRDPMTFKFRRDGKEFVTIGLRGHIVGLDFPPKYKHWGSVDPSDLIFAEPVKRAKERKTISLLKDFGADAERVWVATDYDREGELIGLETLELAKIDKREVLRPVFSAITRVDILEAFNRPRELDLNLAKSAEAREVIDLLWGATLTRIVSLSSYRYGSNFLSVGRVQTPTLAIIVQRYRGHESFRPEKFYIVEAILEYEKEFQVSSGKIKKKEEADRLYARISDQEEGLVTKSSSSMKKEDRPKPFNTTSFLQSASSIGMAPRRAMSIAEGLYMRGLISYPRTDNQVYPSSISLSKVLEKISPAFPEAEDLIKEKNPPSRGKFSHDHPPIHPVDLARGLRGESAKIYELIVRRFMATLSRPVTYEEVRLEVDINGVILKGMGREIREEGWRRVYPYIPWRYQTIPPIQEGEKVRVKRSGLKEEETRPPALYTQGTLIREMERRVLGTKATRPEIIDKLYQRGYIYGDPPIPTALGVGLVTALSETVITKETMTMELEREMDQIAKGERDFEGVVRSSREMLKEVVSSIDRIELGKRIIGALKKDELFGECICGGELVIRRSKRGKRFLGCSNYPKCTITYPLPQKGFLKVIGKCEECGAPIVERIFQRRRLEGCVNLHCPSRR
jgi:DNA topoisomerase-1